MKRAKGEKVFFTTSDFVIFRDSKKEGNGRHYYYTTTTYYSGGREGTIVSSNVFRSLSFVEKNLLAKVDPRKAVSSCSGR